MRHRGAYQLQLRGMKACYERPGTNPSPSPSIYHDYKSANIDIQVVEIGVCPFCLCGFEHVWDCCLVSCRHAYHSWCAVTHSSNSPKCIDTNCGQDMHNDWWVSAGVAKPLIGKYGVLVAHAWERAPLTSKFNLLLLVVVVCHVLLRFRTTLGVSDLYGIWGDTVGVQVITIGQCGS